MSGNRRIKCNIVAMYNLHTIFFASLYFYLKIQYLTNRTAFIVVSSTIYTSEQNTKTNKKTSLVFENLADVVCRPCYWE